MKNRLVLFVAALAVGTFLSLSSQLAVAQQSDSGPNVGQQGEFEGEHVDTGAAALDTGPEAAEAPESGKTEGLRLTPSVTRAPSHSTLASKQTKPMSETDEIDSADTVQDIGPNLNLNLEQGLDLQEIGGVEAPGSH